MITDNEALQLRLTQLEASSNSTMSPSSTSTIPFVRGIPKLTLNDFHSSVKHKLCVLKEDFVSSAEWLAKHGYPSMPHLLCEQLDHCVNTTINKYYFLGRMWRNSKEILERTIKYAKNSGKYPSESFPRVIDEAYASTIIGMQKDQFVRYLEGTVGHPFGRSLLSLLYGRHLKIDHWNPRNYCLQLERSKS